MDETLSDKRNIIYTNHKYKSVHYWEEDLKEAIKKLKEELKVEFRFTDLQFLRMNNCFNKIFGEELTK